MAKQPNAGIGLINLLAKILQDMEGTGAVSAAKQSTAPASKPTVQKLNSQLQESTLK